MARKTPFEREIREFLEKRYEFTHRILDVIGKRFIKKKPADFVACNQMGFFVLVEAKSSRAADRFNFVEIKDHQRKALTTISNTKHGLAFLALNLRGRGNPGQAWMIPWNWWIQWERSWLKKSITRSEAITEFWKFELRRISGGWEMPNVHGPKIEHKP